MDGDGDRLRRAGKCARPWAELQWGVKLRPNRARQSKRESYFF